jgi:PleD family two-component response regulator
LQSFKIEEALKILPRTDKVKEEKIMAPQILVVDDEARYLHLVKVNLEAAGYEVKCASNGEEALE